MSYVCPESVSCPSPTRVGHRYVRRVNISVLLSLRKPCTLDKIMESNLIPETLYSAFSTRSTYCLCSIYIQTEQNVLQFLEKVA